MLNCVQTTHMFSHERVKRTSPMRYLHKSVEFVYKNIYVYEYYNNWIDKTHLRMYK